MTLKTKRFLFYRARRFLIDAALQRLRFHICERVNVKLRVTWFVWNDKRSSHRFVNRMVIVSRSVRCVAGTRAYCDASVKLARESALYTPVICTRSIYTHRVAYRLSALTVLCHCKLQTNHSRFNNMEPSVLIEIEFATPQPQLLRTISGAIHDSDITV